MSAHRRGSRVSARTVRPIEHFRYGINKTPTAYRASVEIAATPVLVFATLTDPEQGKKWQPEVIDSQPPEGGLKVGARAHATVKEYGRTFSVELLVVGLAPNEQLVYEMDAPGVFARIEYRLANLGNRTRVECTMVPRFKGFMLLLSLFLRGMIRRKIEARLALLRDVVETHKNVVHTGTSPNP